MTESMIRIQQQGAAAVITFQQPCISDTEGLVRASQDLQSFITAHNPHWMVFDFADVKFFSSQVLGVILETWARLQSRQGCILISSIDPQLHRVFRITNLDRIFEFFPDRSSALASISTV